MRRHATCSVCAGWITLTTHGRVGNHAALRNDPKPLVGGYVKPLPRLCPGVGTVPIGADQ